MTMANSNSAHRIVKLEDVRQNNIVQIDLNKKQDGAVFAKEYQKAAQIIKKIIKKSKDKSRQDNPYCGSCKSTSCASCKNRNYQGCRGSDLRKYSLTELQTAVPFIGDRGTGKSSVMCSVLESLRGYQGGNESPEFDLDDEARFIAFDMIDANTLKSSENIMEIILSRMLSYLEDALPDRDFRELYRLIDQLHEDLGSVYWKNTKTREHYGLSALQRVADSQKTINSFRELVKQFTQEISACQFGGAPCYLVIALDDIDMYQGAEPGMQDSRFALLEHIYDHMRIPGLIVLLTYNENILRRICNEHFAKIYYGSGIMAEHSQAEIEDIEGLTGQFMSKLFPQEQRIYLPNYLMVSADNHSNLYVKPSLDNKEENKKENQELERIFGEAEKVSAKDFMLRLIAYKTGVFFDIAGTKKHFLEPRNLRELGELFQVVREMKEIPTNTEEQAAVRAYNRQELLNYLYNHFALRYLSSEEYRKFTKLSQLPLERQGRTLVDQIRDHRRDLRLPEDHVAYMDRTKRDRWKYSYGELLHNIYFSTRMPSKPGSDRTFYSKELIHCILGTHSVLMHQDVIGNNNVAKTIGSSIAGRWANQMLPDFTVATSAPVSAGSISMPIRNFIDWEIPEDVQESLLAIYSEVISLTEADARGNSRNKKKNEKTIVAISVSDAGQALRKYLEAFVIVGMFFTSHPQNGLKITVKFGVGDNENPTIQLCSESEDHICFNVLNFVINLFSVEKETNEYLEFVRSKLLKLGRELTKQLSRDWETESNQAETQRAARAEHLREKDPFLYPKDMPVEKMNDPQIQADTNTINTAKVWLKYCYAKQFGEAVFMEIWQNITNRVCDQLEQEIAKWESTYPQFPTVLPVQHFDMMYNIIKRLANNYYHDISEEASVEEVYDYYAQLYESVSEELTQQDQAYHLEGSDSFAQAFRDCAFCKEFIEPKENRNCYIEQILVAMMKKALPAWYGRKESARISALPITRL